MRTACGVSGEQTYGKTYGKNHGETGIPWGKLWENHGETIIPPLNSLSFHVFPRVLLIAKFMNSHSMSYLFVKQKLMVATELHFHFFPAEILHFCKGPQGDAPRGCWLPKNTRKTILFLAIITINLRLHLVN